MGGWAKGERWAAFSLMRRLYLRIYLAIVVTLIVFALAAGIAWHLLGEGMMPRHQPTSELAGDLVAELLPGEADPAAIAGTLQRWHRRGRIDVTLFDAQGRLIETAGPPVPLREPGRGGWVPMRRGPPVFVALLPDGRQLAMRRARPPHGPGINPTWALPGFLVILALLALGIGLGAYPVVRRLTGGIERLQHSVEALGAGDLGVRVKVEGRDEVAALASSFNRSAERIEALVKAQRSLLANASHELRSPLARIRMAIELLSAGEGAEGTRARATAQAREELSRDIAELDQLIDEILLASRLDASSAGGQGSTDEDREEIDLLALCAEECARVRAELDIDPGAAPLILQASGRLLRRMVRNLLENAVRYGQGRPIGLRLERSVVAGQSAAAGTAADGRLIVIEVSDRGSGVPEGERERIFEPFYRARGASERQGSVGLGLSLARQIARRYGGDIRCLARDGGGSRFVVNLPR